MNKRLLFLMAIVMLFVAGCNVDTVTQPEQSSDNSKPLILTTFYPVEEITKAIVQDRAEVKVLVGPGVEPHSFEPTPSQIVEFSKADVFVTMEGLFEHVEEEIISANSDITIIDSAHDVKLIKGDDHDDHGHEDEGHEDEHAHEEDEHAHEEDDHEEHDESEEHSHEEEAHEDEHEMHDEEGEVHEDDHAHEEDDHEHDEHEEGHEDHEEGEMHEDEHDHHDHGEFDPHVWLSIHNMEIMTQEVLEALVELHPENKEFYELNALDYVQKLNTLQAEFSSKLSNCEHEEIIVNHKAFGYLGEEFGFEQVSVAGFSPESEPSPKSIQNVIDEAKEHNLNYVFSEGQIDPKTAQTIANDIGGEVLELNPIKMDIAENYFTIMRDNLDNLAIGLNCQG